MDRSISMASYSAIEALASELAKAIQVIMHPMTTQQARLEAYNACERFKEESTLCAQVGLYLANGMQFSQHIRHFGLQLIEYTIKFKWNYINPEEKIFIKDNALKMLNIGVGPVTDRRLLHLKDGLSRIIVEMIKREWPQQWTGLLTELSQACNTGEAQTELVLLVFLRLVEDVALLQTIESNQRRKDIYQALNNNMNDIFVFFLRLVEQHVNAFREATAQGDCEQASAHSRVVEMVLLTMSGFVDWVSIQHVVSNNGRLLHFLCLLLNDTAFQCNAAECLAQITNRKGQVKERKPLLMLYGKEPLHYIYTASQLNPDTTTSNNIAQHHNFLKKLVSVLSGLVQQLILLWSKEEALEQRPPHLEVMLECLLSLAQHPSLSIAHGAVLIWQMLLKHDGCAKDIAMDVYIPKLIQSIGPRIIKLSYPSTRYPPISNTTETYICIEFDSEEEFALFYFRCRSDFLEIFRQATLVQPLITFTYCEQWLKLRLQNALRETGNITCNAHDPVYLEWEAMVSVIDGVLSRILLVAERPSVHAGLNLLEECLNLNVNNPLIFSVLLSCISALFVFLSMSACQITANNCVAMNGVTLLPRVLEKIFAALVFKPPNDIEKIQQKAIKNLQRHAASLLVKLAHKYPLLLLPVFDQVNSHIKCLLKSTLPQQMCRLVRTTLQEALILISNHFCDYERQTLFIEHILLEKQTEWIGFSDIFKSALDFMRFVGLHKASNCQMDIGIAASNRARIMDALYVVLSVIKRCTWPDDPDRAQRGGFVVGFTELGNPICRNPATKHIIPLLSHILGLVRILNELFTPEALDALSESYRNIYSMVENEKKNLMGIYDVPIDPLDISAKSKTTPFDKMQTFITMLTEGSYHLLGAVGPSLGRDLYQLEGLAGAIIGSVFTYLDVIPDYRLRPIIRIFFKSFVYSCPPAYYDAVLLPMFAHLAPFMCERLTGRWLYITTLYESGQLKNDDNDTQEVVEDQLNRTLTREYLDVLKIALVGGQITNDHINGGSSTSVSSNIDNDVIMENEEHSIDSAPQTRTAQAALLSDIISDLGAKILHNNMISNYVLMTLLNAIVWNDGISNMRAVNITAPVMRFLASEQLMDTNKAITAFTAVLQGMQVHGQHEANQSALITLGVQIYELLRPKFPMLIEILQRIPNVNVADVQKFDEKIATVRIKGNKVDRAKKDIFKKLTAQLVGRSINQLFRHEIRGPNLPIISDFKFEKQSTDIMDRNQNSNISMLFHDDK